MQIEEGHKRSFLSDFAVLQFLFCNPYLQPVSVLEEIGSAEGRTKGGCGMEMAVKSHHAFALEDRLIDFGVRVITVVESMPDSRAANHIAWQLVRSGTSPAPNYAEAQSAESRNDFIHKLKICLKELRETRVWLLMIQRKKLISSSQRLQPLLTECEELIAIFVASINTAMRNKTSKAPNKNTANGQ